MKKFFSLVISALYLPSIVSADVLCYRIDSRKKDNRNVVQIFSGNTCPRRYAKIDDSALGQVLSIKGATGVTGTQGKQGPEGPQGNKGPQGDIGAKGETGEKGDTGLQGDIGLQGIDGEVGDVGLDGLQGAQGEQGLAGDKGETGDDGISKVALFDFYGSTAGDTLQKNRFNELQINQAVAPNYFDSSSITYQSRAVPASSSCSKIKYYIESNGHSHIFITYRAPASPAIANYTLCEGDICSGEIQLNTSVGTLFDLYSQPLDSPVAATRASWNIKCIEH